jgi:hypothetical protein
MQRIIEKLKKKNLNILVLRILDFKFSKAVKDDTNCNKQINIEPLNNASSCPFLFDIYIIKIVIKSNNMLAIRAYTR